MKKLVAVALLGAALAAMAPAHASHGSRTVEGSVLVPTVNQPIGLVTRHARCAYLIAGEAAQGIVGHVIALDAATDGDGAHSFTLAAVTAGADFGVVFYEDLGTCDGVTGPGPAATGTFDNPGDEADLIPEFSTFAIVVVQGAVDADFSFTVL